MIRTKYIQQGQRAFRVVVLVLFVAFSLNVFSQACLPSRPIDYSDESEVLVNDFADFIPDSQEAALNRKLVEFARSSSNQIMVMTVNDLCGFSLNQFSYKIIDKWGLGQADKDNGLLLLIKPKTNSSKGEVYIAPGRGLEGAIPDLMAHRIIEEVIIPEFKQGDYVGGINSGTDAIISLAKGEYDEAVDMDRPSEFPVILFIFLGIFLFIFVSGYFNHKRRVREYALLNNISLAEAALLLNQQSISRNRHRGGSSWNGGGWSGGGGGWSGGGSSGGFGGFGGGSSSGGGAGGSW